MPHMTDTITQQDIDVNGFIAVCYYLFLVSTRAALTAVVVK